MPDPHDVRMQAGQNVMAVIDALDDETLALFEPAAAAMHDLSARFREQGLTTANIMQVLVGVAVAAALDET